ncbi:hypothetical protein pdam_00018717 [Pocillopora damicornis]|uniref:Peptidase C76 domain-containing protein n=1 Tax=Pocillopora damicornis TaxID=46731 RepID=A0A3M6TYQ8_POCDA|nr:hypothetical protein pdam_00018717 [Pocillopora damicornis]
MKGPNGINKASTIALGQKPQQMSYKERCKLLGWSTLECLREYFPFVKCYKVVIKLSYLNSHDYFKYSNSSTRFTVEIHSRFVPTLKYVERFRNGSVREPYDISLYERTFMSEPFIEKHTISTELSNFNREKHRRNYHRVCRCDREPSRLPTSLKRLRNKSRKNEAHAANYCNCKLSRDTEKNPGPLTYVDPNKTIVASRSQGNELVFGQNGGQQCVAMSLCSLIYNDTQGISSANDLIQIMNIGNQLYSTKREYLMQSELPTALNVFDTDYQLEYSESYSGTVLQEIAIGDISTLHLYKEPLSRSNLKATPISYYSRVYYCKSNMGLNRRAAGRCGLPLYMFATAQSNETSVATNSSSPRAQA